MNNLILIIILFFSFLVIVIYPIKQDFNLMYVKANRGRGKTLFSTLYALDYREYYPNNYIYSNYKLNLPKCIYHPFMIIPFSKIENALIIIDDIRSMKNHSYFANIICNWSRKSKLHIILTGQYYTHFKRELRELAEYLVEPNLNNDKSILRLIFIDNDDNILKYKIKNPIEIAKSIYNTYEKIPLSTNNQLEQMIRDSKDITNMDDLECCLMMYFDNRKSLSLLGKIAREKGFVK